MVEPSGEGRRYRMAARAEKTRLSGNKIIDAALQLFTSRVFEEVALSEVAAMAGVTVQTVLRRFGSKEGLLTAAAEHAETRVRSERIEGKPGNMTQAVDNLLEHYEAWGDRILLLLAQESRVPALREVTDRGRRVHQDWVDTMFAPQMAGWSGAELKQRRAAALALTDVHSWKIWRGDLGLSKNQVRGVLLTALTAVLEDEVKP